LKSQLISSNTSKVFQLPTEQGKIHWRKSIIQRHIPTFSFLVRCIFVPIKIGIIKNKQISKMENKQKVVSLLKAIETGATEPVGY
jgi:hypothetical protein